MTSSQVKREYLQTRFRNNFDYNLISIYRIFRQEGRRCQPAVLYLYLQFNLFLPLLWRPAPSPPHCITELKSLISTYQVNNLHGNEKLQTRKPENQKPVTGLVCQVCQAWPAIPVWRLLLTAKTKFYYITRTTDICFSCLGELGYKILVENLRCSHTSSLFICKYNTARMSYCCERLFFKVCFVLTFIILFYLNFQSYVRTLECIFQHANQLVKD